MENENIDRRFGGYAQISKLHTPILNLLLENLPPSQYDYLLDIGCGAGLQAVFLSNKYKKVIGIDSSESMIRTSKLSDKEKRVKWIKSNINTIRLLIPPNSILFSFESFHLIERSNKILEIIKKTIGNNGVLAIGWIEYFWESILKQVVTTVYKNHNIIFKNWGIQKCYDVDIELNSLMNTKFRSNIYEASIFENWTTFDIAKYLINVSPLHKFEKSKKEEIRLELINTISSFNNNETKLEGITNYYLKTIFNEQT